MGRSLLMVLVLWALVGAQASGAGRAASGDREVAIFAGGCFWCMEPPFDKLDGVISTRSGYIGGTVKNPSYKQVSSGSTGHAEAVEVVYSPSLIDYPSLLAIFWRNIDPLDNRGQFCDKGNQYRSGIFYRSDTQRVEAELSLKNLRASARFSKAIVTEITFATMFYAAEEYHQNYYLKNPLRYKYYRYSCGRDKRLEALWGPRDKDSK